MPATTITSPTTPIFDVNTLRRLSNAGSGSGSGSASASNTETYSTDDGPELKDDPAHRQDWSKTTAADESWAIRERRRLSMWSKAEMPISPKKTTGGPRMGSVLSVWVPGKDKDGNDILVHDSGDEAQEELDRIANGEIGADGKKVVVVEEDPSEEVKKLRRELAEMKAKLARLQPEEVKDDGEFLLTKPKDVTGETARRKSRGSRGSAGQGAERRGSILSLWAQGTDKQGNAVIMHRDDEWKKEDEDVIVEEKEPVNVKY
ncbi:hypothetical protein WAI453_012006 [Rhynchosporium graminicola]|uniref:Uncharacterized protein n=1 Tax=Rhynchosporium graminicola TaxID=2792576 RepID=A0A1E1KJP2_9HELO|nr:uncharacterized protein RCO7_08932 [Rhynchosporium commune]